MIPSASIPQISLAAIFKLNLEQFKTVSVEATSAAVLPNPVGLMIPVAVEPPGLLIVIVLIICTESPTIFTLCIFGA